ncbi:hypothetical protein QBC33DRAFT_112707 [Phialemonium atrogriseum]|uniref:Uncharacterized protein n=1 Tax=Phialemonium atrogriseum TaxID=1093897 RepID=A0AAJ0FMJ2_9PEZI|nr:uncharacterized protein QBC33DRAFT_112707 [Phialemonium atrogriseum]KAK1766200.1 hypothetical protein QBC33DRAFT_112707 [Phialemonium atrogriseum]
MVNYRIFAFAGLAAALPLNINLGAYSPALVVGDGEISFGGKQDVSNLMNALEGAAINAAAGAGVANTANAAATNTVAGGSGPITIAPPDSTLSDQAGQIASLQGLGKEIAPRVETDDAPKAKRDLAGFDRALKYAEAALVKGPKVQLGTGAEGSGVGIIVDNSPSTRGAAAKRDIIEASASRVRAKVTTMYVRRGVPASLQPSSNEARALAASLGAAPAPVLSTRDALDAVNLNVDGDEGVTLTFVEELAGDEDEDEDEDED